MRKIYFSLITIAILLFTACTNDVPGNEKEVETGTLTATISFGGKELKSAQAATRATATSTAIPVVGWDNVSQVQLFLYNDENSTTDPEKIVFSYIFNLSEYTNSTNTELIEGRIYSIPNVPLGKYKLALLANANAAANGGNNIVTSFDGGANWNAVFTNMNVRGQKISEILVDLKDKSLPAIPNYIPADEMWAGRTGYDAPSELFTAFLDEVEIKEGNDNKVTIQELKREISLMRTRFDIEAGLTGDEATNREKVNFDHEDNFIVIQQLPDYFSLNTGMSSGSIETEVFVAAQGTGIYKDENAFNSEILKFKTKEQGGTPAIIDTKYKHWHDINIFPNAVGRTIAPDQIDNNAASGKEYFIIISAWVDLSDGGQYKYEDGTVVTTSQQVYWWAVVDKVFTRNVIREVNLTLKTAGYPTFPDKPTKQGSLEITIGAPEEWHSIIGTANMDI